MTEELTLNKNAINSHAKRLLAMVDPEDPEYLSPAETLNSLYLLELIAWYLNQPDQPYYPVNQEMMQEKLNELMYDLTPKQAWKWLNLSKRHQAIQETTTPEQGGKEATEVLRMQLFYGTQEMEEVIKRTPRPR